MPENDIERLILYCDFLSYLWRYKLGYKRYYNFFFFMNGDSEIEFIRYYSQVEIVKLLLEMLDKNTIPQDKLQKLEIWFSEFLLERL